ncbi:MAG: hypothetical protein L3J93_02370 [Thermoplasmata archaeon]|nr:hypothetical protein [Thermoplasmata archaeon]
MSLERLVEEVRRRSDEDLSKEQARFAAEAQKLLDLRANQLEDIGRDARRRTAIEEARVRSGRVARAKLDGRRLVFEAREAAAQAALREIRSKLGDLADSDAYAPLLRRMYAYALGRLGKPVRLAGRSEDAQLLRALVGRSGGAPGTLPVLGGFVAESADGSRRLDLTFDELLRRREDRVLELARTPKPDG